MRLRSSLAFGVTAAAAATLAPAVVGSPAVADEGNSVLNSNVCAVTGLFGGMIPDSSCGGAQADAAATIDTTQTQPQQPQVQQPQAQQPQAQQPQVQQPQAQQPQAQQPQVQQPQAQQPQAQQPQAQQPQAQQPQAQQPQAQQPQAQKPQPQQPRPNEALTSTTPTTAQPTCATTANSNAFPIKTAIHDGPTTYVPGGGFQNWTVDLTNTTGDSCGNIHPVVVFVDQEGTLKAQQPQLEFYDGSRWRPVPFTHTGKNENVGVFDDGFAGFTVPPGQTVSVKVRLSFTSDTAPNHVVANAAIVQRRADDGDWVGQSNDYPFEIVASGEADKEHTGSTSPRPDAAELAKTGSGAMPGLGVTAGAFLLGGGALVVGYRRLRRR
ncbi:hypothetical protein [Streptomyces sp. NPDC059009]|uniref:hypothetical protein n=1 Tax=Streptomyces sp. NPDC059009 TaxID=3346694 RepID=UPI0036C15422